MSYKITFNLISPICFIDLPILDSILAYCIYKKENNQLFQKLNYNKIIDFDLPIEKDKNSIYKVSQMFYNKNINFQGSWKKRWEGRFDKIVDFEGKRKKVQINSGKFKSYSIPLNLFSIKEVWFYFCGDCKEVEELIKNYLVGIGKKISQGFGWFDSFKIEKSDKNFEKELLRPIPIKFFDSKQDYEKKLCGWKIPNWLPENQDICYIPNLKNI